jgi:hypothetical protein
MLPVRFAVASALVVAARLASADPATPTPAPPLTSTPPPPPTSTSTSPTPSTTPSPATAIPPLAPPPPSSSSPPALSPDDDPLFHLHYAEARLRLVTGDFAGAASAFDEAARFAANPCNRALAEEQRTIAKEWAARGLALVQHVAVGENSTSRAVDKRTSDEIVSLYTNAALYGIGTGIWIAVAADAQTTAAEVLPSLVLGGAAIGGVAALDSGRGLRYGVAQSIVSGMYVGLEEGIAWTLWKASDPNGTLSGPAAATILWGTTTGGLLAGGLLATAIPTTPGRAAFVGSTSLWGGVLAGLTTGAISSDSTGRTAMLASAVGVNAGVFTGLLTAGAFSPSIAHARFLDLGGIGGMLVGGGIYLAAANQNINGQALAGTAALGTAAGLFTAWLATRSMARDEGATQAPKPAKVVWNPTVMPAKSGGMLGVVGQM